MFRTQTSIKKETVTSPERKSDTCADPDKNNEAANINEAKNINEAENSNEVENIKAETDSTLNTDSIKPKKTVTFSRKLIVVLIPTRHELHRFKLDLWYTKAELRRIRKFDRYEVSLIKFYWRRVMSEMMSNFNSNGHSALPEELKNEEFILR